jgi:hypothetical protein
MVTCCCENLVTEAGDISITQRKEETSTVEAATKQRLVKTVTGWEDLVCPVVICK